MILGNENVVERQTHFFQPGKKVSLRAESPVWRPHTSLSRWSDEIGCWRCQWHERHNCIFCFFVFHCQIRLFAVSRFSGHEKLDPMIIFRFEETRDKRNVFRLFFQLTDSNSAHRHPVGQWSCRTVTRTEMRIVQWARIRQFDQQSSLELKDECLFFSMCLWTPSGDSIAKKVPLTC